MLSQALVCCLAIAAEPDATAPVPATIVIDLATSAVAGDAQAPVAIVEYACARCPFCAKLTPQLYDAVTTGPLKGKARLYLKLFPLKNHPGGKEMAMAFEAAAALGAFWPYVLHTFAHFDEFAVDKRTAWARAVGLDVQAFGARLTDPKLVDRLVASKKEGIVNGVDGTPTLFLNAKRYDGKHSLADIIVAVGVATRQPSSAP
jgi:protein-disulfide isomerase